jgi:hypothetical protein
MTRYKVETTPAELNGKPITLTQRTPIMSAMMRDKRKKEVEARLYEICCKHIRASEERKAQAG